MSVLQYRLLKQYSQSLQIQNNSKLNQINFLVSELNRISEDNKILNQQLNFISINNNNRQMYENQIHELEYALQERQEVIEKLAMENGELERLLNQKRERQFRKNVMVNGGVIEECPVEEDQKTERMSQEAAHRIQQLETTQQYHLQLINNLQEKLIQKQIQISQLIFEDKNKIKIIEDYILQRNDHQQRLGALGNQYDLLQLSTQNLRTINQRTLTTNVTYSNQIEELKRQIQKKDSKVMKQSLGDIGNVLLNTKVSELSAEVMLGRMREEEWEQESRRLRKDIGELRKEIQGYKTKGSIQNGERLVSSMSFVSPMKTSVTMTECESSGTKTDSFGGEGFMVGNQGRIVQIQSSGNIPLGY